LSILYTGVRSSVVFSVDKGKFEDLKLGADNNGRLHAFFFMFQLNILTCLIGAIGYHIFYPMDNSNKYFEGLKQSSEELTEEVLATVNDGSSSSYCGIHNITIKLLTSDTNITKNILKKIDGFTLTINSSIEREIEIVNTLDKPDNLRQLYHYIDDICKVTMFYYKKNPLLIDPYLVIDKDESLGILDIRMLSSFFKLTQEEQMTCLEFNSVRIVIDRWFNHLTED